MENQAFQIGDLVTINLPTNLEIHEKTGTIVNLRATQCGPYLVETSTSRGTEYFEVMPNQIVKVIIDPAFLKLKTETLPELIRVAGQQYNSDEDKIVDEANQHIRLIKSGMLEGYKKGFTDGYVQGYNDACTDVQRLFVQSGIIGKPNGST